MKRFLHDNGLGLALACLFLGFWAGQAIAGFKVHNQERTLHAAPPAGFTSYLASSHFWQATAENWESEFLQMGAYVAMTAFLFQRGSAESKDPDDPAHPENGDSRHGWVYRNSLSLAFLLLFALSFAIHAVGGWRYFNEERVRRGEPETGFAAFLGEAEFWFQSFQNWQSEFLAVLSIVVLSIFLRQQGSPESKAVDAPHSKTGR